MKKLYKLLIICLLTIAGGSNALNAKSYNNGDTKNNLATTNTNSTVTYTITVNASPSSYGTVSGGGEYEEGSIVTLTAVPKSGREFVEWQKDGVQVSTDTEYTFTVTESCTLTAKFKYKEYSITYYANDGSEQTYVDHKSHGSNYNIINHTTCGFTPPEGMVFIAWARNSVDGYQMAPGQSISNNSDCSFYAIWDTPVVSVIIGNDTTQYGSLVDAFNYANGKTATITMLKDWDNSVLSDHPKFTSNNTIVTLDLNGKRIYNDSYPSESNALEFSGDCIIKNGEIEFTGGGQYIKFYSTSSQKKLTIQGNVKITNKNSYGRCISLGNNNTVIIENGAEISSPNNNDTNEAAIFFYGNGTLIINGGTISSKKNCIFSNNNAPNSIVVVNAGNFNNVKAGDVYFNVEHNTTVIGNAWYKLTNNIPSTTATIEYTSNTTKYNETTYGLANNIVSVTATPTNNDIKISKLLANDIEATLTNDIYSFTMPKTIVTLSAETIDLIGNNKCGDNLYWYVDDENILTIFGTGAMYDYGSDNNKAPWCSLNPAPTSLVLEEGITHIGNYAFYDCSGFTGSLTIPNSVTTIGNYAFYYCYGFTGSLTIPNSVTSIGNYAFENCYGFTGSLTIPNSVTTIGNYAFGNCYGFTGSLTIPNSVTAIEGFAFSGCSGFTGSLTIPNSVTTIGNDAFCNCSGFNGSLTIPNSVTTIGNAAFYGCDGFTGSLTIPNSVTYIGNYAFVDCSGFKGSLTIPNSVTSIGNYAFYDCSGFTGDLTILNSVTTIGDWAFADCRGFTGSLTIPNSVTTIGVSAFRNCSGFTGSLTIPNSVTSIGNYAFYNCSGFTDIFFYRDANPTIGTSVFSGINANAKVYAPVIWESFDNIPEDKLVKMATFVGQQSTDNGQQSSSTGWVGLAEGQTEPNENDHVAVNAPLVLGQQTTDNGQQTSSMDDNSQQPTDNGLWVKSFGYCGDGTTVNGSITIEDGGQLYCEAARGEVTVKKDIIGYASQQSTDNGQQTSSTDEEQSTTKWYTIASPLKDTLLISDPQFLNSSVPQFLSSNSDLYRYDEPSYTWQNAKNSANNGFNTIDPGRGYLYANAENTTLEFTGDINTETATYNLTAKSDVLNGFHLIGNPFTHDIYLGESIKTKETQNIIFELNDSYGDGWDGNALNLSFSDETPDKIITIESGNSKTETINVASGVTVTVSFTIGNYPEECSFTIKYDDETVICDEYSSEGSLTSVENGATLTRFTVKEGIDVLVNGYYTLTGEGAWAAEASTTEAIKPMQGILVKSLVDDYELHIFNISRQPSAISRQRSGRGQQSTVNRQQTLGITVANAQHSDRAFVVFDKGVGLDKINHENENIPLLYIPMDDADYAIAMMDMNVNEIPVSFETKVMGQYTISLRQDNCEFDELYLLDKETDEKVNILEQDYTFIATSSDAPERFVLLKDNGQQTTDNSHFAYINNGDIVIYDIEGKAQISIFDALGRCVYHGESSDETTRIANGYSSGVYMIQKVDDKGVNVQKVIID